MEWFNRQKITTKTFLTALAVIATYAAVALYSWQRYSFVHQREHEIGLRQMPPLQALADLRSGLNAHQRSQFEYLLAGNDTQRQEFEKRLRTAAAGIQAAQAKYDLLISKQEQEERDRFEELTSNLAEYLAVSQEAMDLARGGHPSLRHGNRRRKRKPEKLATDALFGPERNALNQTFAALQIVAAANSRAAEAASHASNELFASTQRAVETAFAIGSFLSLVIALLMGRMIVRSLREVITATNAKDTGDLMLETIAENRRDEVGELALRIGELRTKQREMIQTVAFDLRRFAEGIEPVSLAIQQQREGIHSQLEQVLQVSEAARQVASRVKEISDLSNQAAETARQSAETAGKGDEMVETMQSRLRSIVCALGGISKSIQDLGKASEQIAQFVSVIDDIASQTNLLALNSAIEAARAGEHGRGFSVVAGEVMKLAERTTRATKEIGLTITRIQTETKNAVVAVNEGTSLGENAVNSTRQAAELLRNSIVLSQVLGDSLSHIAKLTAGQTGSDDQIAVSLEHMSNTAKNSAARVDGSASALKNLAGIAGELQLTISSFCAAPLESTRPEAPERALVLERKRLIEPDTGDGGRGHAAKGLALAAPAGPRPGVARIHARLLTPETDSEFQRPVPSTASAGRPA